jgi:hypothetical protein
MPFTQKRPPTAVKLAAVARVSLAEDLARVERLGEFTRRTAFDSSQSQQRPIRVFREPVFVLL